MNKNGEFNTQGMLIAGLTVGLFFGLMGWIVGSVSNNYDIAGYDSTDITGYDQLQNLSSQIVSVNEKVTKATVDPGWFDFFSGIWNKLITPFKFAYGSYKTIETMAVSGADDLKLPKVVLDYFISVLSVLVIVGIVMIKFYLGRKK